MICGLRPLTLKRLQPKPLTGRAPEEGLRGQSCEMFHVHNIENPYVKPKDARQDWLILAFFCKCLRVANVYGLAGFHQYIGK